MIRSCFKKVLLPLSPDPRIIIVNNNDLSGYNIRIISVSNDNKILKFGKVFKADISISSGFYLDQWHSLEYQRFSRLWIL